jgi:hypothetical protein
MAAASPRVVSIEWGRIEIEDGQVLKDVKLWPGGARAWDWDETGTRHAPGVQAADLTELLPHAVTVVVVGTGYRGRLGVSSDALTLLDRRGVTCHVLPTPEAVALYNQLCATKPVGALIHTTC